MPISREATMPGRLCFACNNPATSRDHFPAKGFFPKALDLPDNMQTVDACCDCNRARSKDDEYLREVIARSIFAVGSHADEVKQVVDRARERSLERGTVLLPEREAQAADGATILVADYNPDRVDRTLGAYARAVFNYTTSRRILGRLNVAIVAGVQTENILARSPHLQAALRSYEAAINRPHWAGRPWCGAVPDVFRYRTLTLVESGWLTEMRFYNDFLVFVHAPPSTLNEAVLVGGAQGA